MSHPIIESVDIGTVDGFDLSAAIVHDPDTRPEDKEAYDGDTEVLNAWNRDEWHFVGTIVTASKAGVELGAASLWGSEYGLFPDTDGWVSPLNGVGTDRFINGYGPDLIAEAITEAQAKIKELTA